MNKLLSTWNIWIDAHQSLVVAVGVPLLTAISAAIVAWLTNRVNIAAQNKQRALEKAIKLADFRQNWINDLRSDFATYAGLHTKAFLDFSDSDFIDMIQVGSRILMRMNRNDPDFSSVERSVTHAVDRASVQNNEREKLGEKYKDLDPIVIVGQRVLKREWERLKDDLRKVEN